MGRAGLCMPNSPPTCDADMEDSEFTNTVLREFKVDRDSEYIEKGDEQLDKKNAP